MERSWMIGMEEMANFWTAKVEGTSLKQSAQVMLEAALILHTHKLLRAHAVAETT